MRPRVVICIPTYNEAPNLERLIHALAAELDVRVFDASVLNADDSSPDGTGELADVLASKLRFLNVVHRPRKAGIGPAYLEGFGHALAAGADLVLSMDCDFSHDPADVSRLLEASTAADIVVGSRYAPGGAIQNWG